MAKKDAAAVAAKWSTNLGNATESIRSGVNAVTVNPAQLAKAALPTMKARVIAAIDSGKVAAGLDRTTLGSWQSSMINKGLPRVAQGASDAVPKMQTFMSQLLPYTAQLSSQIKSMPNATVADRKARMMANFDGMSQFKRQNR